MSLLTYGCPDPTKGRTEEPNIVSLWGTIWIDEDKPITAKFQFSMYNGIIYNVKIYIENKHTTKFDIMIREPKKFDDDFKLYLEFLGIQFEEIKY